MPFFVRRSHKQLKTQHNLYSWVMFVARKFSKACIVALSTTRENNHCFIYTDGIRELKITNLQTNLLWWQKDLRDTEGSHIVGKNFVE